MNQFFLKRLLTVVAVSGLFGVACSQSAPSLDQLMLRTKNDLIASGQSLEVADCVAGLAKDQLRRGEVSETALESLTNSCDRASSRLAQIELEKKLEAQQNDKPERTEPLNYGDDSNLDRLWDSCDDGDGQACETLFVEAPIGSEYENFGVSCGQREVIYNCRELNLKS